VFFWGTTWILQRKSTTHACIATSRIRQFGGILYVSFSCTKKERPKEKWKTIIILSILNFALSNGLSTWGKIHSSLGAILNAVFPLWLLSLLFLGAKN
jgi:hypothetical protein